MPESMGASPSALAGDLFDTLGLQGADISVVSQNRGTHVYRVSHAGQDYALKVAQGPVENSVPDGPYDARVVLVNEAEFLSTYGAFGEGHYVNHGTHGASTWLLLRWSHGIRASDHVGGLKAHGDNAHFRLEACRFFLLVVREVHKLHALGYVHGDLQPAHLLFSNGRIRLIDFGLTHSPSSRSFQYKGGMVHFNSPEVCRGMLERHEAIPMSVRSEVYSVASVCQFLFTSQTSTDYGAKPYAEMTLDEVLSKVIDTEPRRLLVFPGLDQILSPCLHKDERTRPESLLSVIAALEALIKTL